MIEIFSNEFWIAILFFISFFLIFFVLLLMKKINNLNLTALDQNFQDQDFNFGNSQNDGQEDVRKVSGSALEIIDMLEPLVKESRKAAISFDKQVKEKKRLLKELTNALDTRLISINLLLSRADAFQKKIEERQSLVNHSRFEPDTFTKPSENAVDQQNEIIELYNQNLDSDSIAQRLSIPKGEVQLVIDLKKKLVAMEENSR